MAEDHRREHAARRSREDGQLQEEGHGQERPARPGERAADQSRARGGKAGGSQRAGPSAARQGDDVGRGEDAEGGQGDPSRRVEGGIDVDRGVGARDGQRLVGQEGQDPDDDRACSREHEEPAGRLGSHASDDDRDERAEGEAGQDRPVDEREVLGDPFRRHRSSVAEDPRATVSGRRAPAPLEPLRRYPAGAARNICWRLDRWPFRATARSPGTATRAGRSRPRPAGRSCSTRGSATRSARNGRTRLRPATCCS